MSFANANFKEKRLQMLGLWMVCSKFYVWVMFKSSVIDISSWMIIAYEGITA